MSTARQALDASRRALVAARRVGATPPDPAPEPGTKSLTGGPVRGEPVTDQPVTSPSAAVGDDPQRAAVESSKRELSAAWREQAFVWVTGTLAAAAVIAVIVALWARPQAGTALAVAAPLTVVLITLVGLLPGWKNGGIVAFLVGRDNRLSTSKMQIGLWTAAVAFAFLFFIAQLVWPPVAGQVPSGFGQLAPEYLLLLGGPFAAAVLASATTSSKVSSGAVQQVTADAPQGKDLVTDQDGQPAISDAQFFLFNLVALVYFAVTLARHPGVLPNIPPTLVGLTSVSALTYLGAKVVASNTPTITTVLITSAGSDGQLHPGDTIQVIGSGFRPPASKVPEKDEQLAVLFGNVAAYPNADDPMTDTSVIVQVPPGLGGTKAVAVPISVLSAAGVQSAPYSNLQIVERDG